MALDPISPLAGMVSIDGAVSAVTDAASAAAKAAASAATGGVTDWLTGRLPQIVMIVLGLLLIAAGIFSFDKTRELVVSTAKGASKAAAAAA